VSIPSNIAEGHERRSRADYRRSIAIACGSLAELETQLDLAGRLHSVEKTLLDPANDLADEVGRLLRSIERSLRVSGAGKEQPVWDAFQPSALGPQPSP
jgi:four helix bundle protein